MGNHNNEHGYEANHPMGFPAGLLIGSLAGAGAMLGAMLLLAPQSGKKTRAEIQQKTMALRDQTVETVEDAVAQARVTARQVTDEVHKQAEELQQRGQELLGEHSERLPAVVEVKKKAVHGSR